MPQDKKISAGSDFKRKHEGLGLFPGAFGLCRRDSFTRRADDAQPHRSRGNISKDDMNTLIARRHHAANLRSRRRSNRLYGRDSRSAEEFCREAEGLARALGEGLTFR